MTLSVEGSSLSERKAEKNAAEGDKVERQRPSVIDVHLGKEDHTEARTDRKGQKGKGGEREKWRE